MRHKLQVAIRRFQAVLAIYLLAATAIAFGLYALYIYAAGVLGPMLAAVVTAGGALVLAGLTALGGFTCRTVHRPRQESGTEAQELGAMAARLVKDNATKATVAALATGFALGVSPRLRRSLLRMLRESQKH
ncbi:MAG: hypothetical protein ACRES9_10135 [Gammaproteobacteria bacterium]